MPELAGDELERGTSAGHPDGPVVPGIVQPVAAFDPQGAEMLVVHVPGLPAIYAAEHAFSGQHGREMRLHEGPRPVSHPSNMVSGPRLGASGPHLPRRGIDIGLYYREDGADLEASAIGEREDRSEGRGSAFGHSENLGQLEEDAAGVRRRRA